MVFLGGFLREGFSRGWRSKSDVMPVRVFADFFVLPLPDFLYTVPGFYVFLSNVFASPSLQFLHLYERVQHSIKGQTMLI
jgi:hypothetical protein